MARSKKSGFPRGGRKLFQRLIQEVMLLHADWIVYKEIFDEQNFPLLNDTAPGALYRIQYCLRSSVFLNLMRLVEHPGKGKRTNLTLPRLLEVLKPPVSEPKLYAELEKRFRRIKRVLQPVERIRHKTLGHNDLKTKMSSRDVLPKITAEHVNNALELIAELVNVISCRFQDDITYYFGAPVSIGGGKDLVFFLQEGYRSRMAELLRFGRIGRGEMDPPK